MYEMYGYHSYLHINIVMRCGQVHFFHHHREIPVTNLYFLISLSEMTTGLAQNG